MLIINRHRSESPVWFTDLVVVHGIVKNGARFFLCHREKVHSGCQLHYTKLRDVALDGGSSKNTQPVLRSCSTGWSWMRCHMNLKAGTATSSDRIFTVLSILTSAVSPPRVTSVILRFAKVWTVMDTARWDCQAGCTVAVQPAIHLQSFS